jgi:hypothetical protein
MRWSGVALAVLLVGCSTSTPISSSPTTPSPASSAQSPAQGAYAMPGGCGSTPVVGGAIPAWMNAAGANNNPTGVPYVVASPAIAGGFVFGYPLRAGHPYSPTNKILWVVGLPRNGSSLEISGHPLNAATPSVTVTQPADSSPGEIYPSIVDVPKPGCWHFNLAWSGNRTSVDLMYR